MSDTSRQNPPVGDPKPASRRPNTRQSKDQYPPVEGGGDWRVSGRQLADPNLRSGGCPDVKELPSTPIGEDIRVHWAVEGTDKSGDTVKVKWTQCGEGNTD